MIRRRDELILPLHGGPVTLDPGTVARREAISEAIDRVLARGRAEGTVGPRITSGDIIIMGALLAQPLPYAPDWERTARRAARSTSPAWPRIGAGPAGRRPDPRRPRSGTDPRGRSPTLSA